MTLREILQGVQLKGDIPSTIVEATVSGLDYDSRRVKEGCLFFAFQGQHTDGVRYATQALEQGAVAVVSESPKPEGFPGAWIETVHGRQALALASRNFYDSPDSRLGLVAITGTNGKTTTAFITDSILKAAGKTAGLIGTIEYRLPGRAVTAVNTTPESLDLCRIFTELLQASGTHATMEVSSHALALGRVHGFQFHTAVFTNLTRDHLDFHHTMEEYFEAKRQLFQGQGSTPPRFAVLNGDDPYCRQVKPPPETEVIWYGLGSEAQVRASNISATLEGLRFEVHAGEHNFEVTSAMLGKMNVYNILAACGAAISLDVEPADIARGVAECRSVPGRLEQLNEGQPFMVVVDYAHTDDALRNVIAAVRGLSPRRVITVFGCGGDRDRTKRPRMGEAVGETSDFAVLTSDNPRSEDPLDIINDVLVGLRRSDVPHIVDPDRESAIRRAIQEADPGDVVIIAGKGHETKQVLKDGTVAFDDREVARSVLRRYGYGQAKA